MAQTLADSLETSVSNQVLERWYFPVIDSVRSFHLSLPVGLVMQSTFRLLVDKTTMQKLFTKINDVRPAIKKFISQVSRSAELHQLL